MKEITVDQIEEGVQFAAIWMYEGHVWCETYLMHRGLLMAFSVETDDFETTGSDSPYSLIENNPSTKFYGPSA